MTAPTPSVWIGLAALVATAFAGPQAGAAPKCLVAQLVAMRGGGLYSQVMIQRGAASFAAHSQEPLCTKDVVSVTAPGIGADVEYAGGATVTARPGASVTVGASQMDKLTEAVLLRMAGLFPAIFDERHPHSIAQTQSAPFRGGQIGYSPLAPADVVQEVWAQPDGVRIPVAWLGGRARVEMSQAGGSLVAQAAPDEEGFAVLYAPRLQPGRYNLLITSDTKGNVALNIAVVAVAPPQSTAVSDVEETLGAAEALKGPANGRLQAMIDVERLKKQNYLAWMLRRGIATGDAALASAP